MPIHTYDPAMRDAIRTEYVSGIGHPSLRDLAARHGISERTLFEWSRTEKWPAQRQAQLQRIAATAAIETEAATMAAVVVENQDRERSTEILRYVRDGLAKAFQTAGKQMIETKGMRPEEAAAIVARWEKLASEDILRFLAQAPRALADAIKGLELLGGRPTERHEISKVPVDLTPEEEEAIDRVWRKLHEVEA